MQGVWLRIKCAGGVVEDQVCRGVVEDQVCRGCG